MYKSVMILSLKTINNLYVFYFCLLHISFASWNVKYPRFLKYTDRVLFFVFPWITCINCICTRGSWFSHFKTSNYSYVFYFCLLYNYFPSWNVKYLGYVKYSDGVLYFGLAWISCINCLSVRGSWFSHFKTIKRTCRSWFSHL